MADQGKIEASKRFLASQRRVQDEADAARAQAQSELELTSEREADERRRDMADELALSHLLMDDRLLSLCVEKLGAAALSNQALVLMAELARVLNATNGDGEI